MSRSRRTGLVARLGFIVAALIAAPVGLGAQTAAWHSVDREVLTRADLRAAGLHRFSDLMPWLATGAASVEGLNWVAGLGVLPPGSHAAEWRLVIDGQPVAIDVHGAQLPELVPLTLEQIDSVEVIRSPVLIAGGFSEGGAVRIHTRATPAGPSTVAMGRHGAETGDPGPLSYTPLATPNVDRSGPDGTAVLAYGGRRWSVETSGRYLRTSVSDSLLWENFGENPFVFAYARGAGVRMTVDAAGGRHRLLAGRFNQLGNSWLPSTGRLGQTDLDQLHLGVDGSAAFGAARLEYRLVRGRIATDLPYLAVPEGDESVRLHGSAEVAVPRGPWRFAGGVAFDRERVEATRTADAATLERSAPALLGSLEHRTSGRDARLLLAFRRVEGEMATRLGGGLAWRLRGDRILALSGTFVDPAPDEPLAWRMGGGGAAPVPERRLLLGSVELSQPLGGRFAVAAGGTIVHLADGVAAAGAEGAGNVAALQVALRSTGVGPLRGTVAYRAVAGDGRGIVPDHDLRGRIAWTPWADVRIGAGFRLATAPAWPVAPLRPASATPTEAISRADVSIEKWFWSRRLLAQLAVANLASAPERYHPAGADFPLRYSVSLTLVAPARD